jgi:hypothetical protein
MTAGSLDHCVLDWRCSHPHVGTRGCWKCDRRLPRCWLFQSTPVPLHPELQLQLGVTCPSLHGSSMHIMTHLLLGITATVVARPHSLTVHHASSMLCEAEGYEAERSSSHQDSIATLPGVPAPSYQSSESKVSSDIVRPGHDVPTRHPTPVSSMARHPLSPRFEERTSTPQRSDQWARSLNCLSLGLWGWTGSTLDSLTP